jgi:hypothetical protein
MDSLDRALRGVERELGVALPRRLFAPGGFGRFAAPVEPERLLAPRGGAVRGGEHLPDALPFAEDGEGGALLLRFDPAGRPAEVVAWRADGAWHPTDEVPGFPSPAARARERAAGALDCGLLRLARRAGAMGLAADLGVTPETFRDWLHDARLVPERSRAALRRLTGDDDAGLFGQDWEGAAAAARRAAEARRELAWPGAVLAWFTEGRGEHAEAAGWWAHALRAWLPTLDLAAAAARPGEDRAAPLAEGWRRCAGPGGAPDPALRAALEGPRAVRAHLVAECDRANAEGRHADAWGHALRAGWQRPYAADLDDVLGRLGDAAEAAGSRALAAIARLHLRAWAASR